MPCQKSLFQLPGGARCIRLEWTGVVTGEEAAAIVAETGPGKPLHGLPMLILTQKATVVESRARNIFGGHRDTPLSEFLAIVATSPIIRVSTNFVMRVTRNPRLRLFATEEEALKWLDEKAREYAASQAKPPVTS